MTLEFLLGNETATDTISCENSDGILLFTLGSTHAVEYALEIDWDGDDVFNGDNEAGYLLEFDISRGRERAIGAPGEGFEPYRIGRAVFTLDNDSGRFNPWNIDSNLYGHLYPGCLMTFRAAVYSTDGDYHTTYDIFTGYVADIQPEGWNKTVGIVCEDGLGMLNRQFSMFGSTFSHITDVMDEYVTLSNYPYSINFSTDDPSSDYLGASAFVNNGNYLKEFEGICSASLGSIAAEGDGTLAYHSIYESDTSIITMTDGDLLNDPVIPYSWEYLRDTTKINVDKLIKYVYTGYLLSAERDEIVIPASDSVTVWLPYSTIRVSGSDLVYFNDLIIDEVTPVVNTVSVYDKTESTTSAVASTNYSYTIDYLPDVANLTFENLTSTDIYLRTFAFSATSPNLYGLSKDASSNDYEISISGSTSYYWSSKQFNITENNYNVVSYQLGKFTFTPAAIIRNQRDRIIKMGSLIHNYLSTARVHPKLQMVGRPEYQWLLDVEKKVTYQSDELGINADYRICGLKHRTNSNTQDVITDIYLYPLIDTDYITASETRFVGAVTSTGGVVDLPDGWGVVKRLTGQYAVTHTLGRHDFTAVVMSKDDATVAAADCSVFGDNALIVNMYDLQTGALADVGFQFIVYL